MSLDNYQEYLEKMKSIQESFLCFIQDESNIEENFENLKKILSNNQVLENKHFLTSFLHLVMKVLNYHHRYPNFISKIEQILSHLKSSITKHFSNFEIFHLFKTSKRALLYLFDEKMIVVDDLIVTLMFDINYQYDSFFYPEMKSFLEDDEQMEAELQNNFYEKRKIGENDDEICKLIQKDEIENFIIYINKNEISVNSTIKSSIYETNNFLHQREKRYDISLIEYAAFFGSIQIFKYLYKNGAELTSEIWIFAIHGDCEELFKILEDEGIEQYDYFDLIKEAIKCHDNIVINYIESNYKPSDFNEKNNKYIYSLAFQYHNYDFFPNSTVLKEDFNQFINACEYDQYLIVEYLIKTQKIDLKSIEENILKIIFFLIKIQFHLYWLLLNVETMKLLKFY